MSLLPLCWCLQSKIVRVLNLWQKNAVFKSDIIQPLLDMAAGIPPPTVTPVMPSSAAPVNNTTPGQSAHAQVQSDYVFGNVVIHIASQQLFPLCTQAPQPRRPLQPTWSRVCLTGRRRLATQTQWLLWHRSYRVHKGNRLECMSSQCLFLNC